MKKTLSVALLAIGSLLLMYCLAFTVVQLCAGDYVFFEEQFIELQLEDSTGISVSDLSQAVRSMVQYMNNQRSSIDVDVMVQGVKLPMFALEIEHVHMVEVRELWQKLVSFRSFSLVLAAVTLLLGFLLDSRGIWNNIAKGYLWALVLFLVLCFFAGIWAGTNFDSFWTLFHRIAFPGSENWILPYESRMIQMLPAALFAALVGRIGLYTLGSTLVLGLLCLLSILFRAGKLQLPKVRKQEQEQAAAEGEDRELEEEGPDLLTLHKLHNTPVSQRGALRKKLEERENDLKQRRLAAEQEERELREENPDRVSIDFAAYEPSDGAQENEDI